MRNISIQREQSDLYLKKVTDLAVEAGRMLLKNGAEIFRVEETITRMCNSYGIDVVDVFTLSHALFVTTQYDEFTYSRIRAVPLAGAHLGIVVEVNKLSRAIAEGKVTIEEAREQLKAINKLPPIKNIYHILAAGTTSICFGALLGAGLAECICAFVIGCLVWCWCIAANKIHMSKIVVNLVGGMILTSLSVIAMKIIPIPMKIDGMIIGAIMPMIPGITFVNAIRDIAGGDYLCGTVRMLDALFVFVYIAVGVGLILGICSALPGGVVL